MFESFKKLIPVPYNYVNPCPICDSWLTGRYIKSHSPEDDDYAIESSLKNGEIVKPATEIPERNCFCLACGAQWIGRVKPMTKSPAEINEERARRCTEDLLAHIKAEKRRDDGQDETLFGAIRKNFAKRMRREKDVEG